MIKLFISLVFFFFFLPISAFDTFTAMEEDREYTLELKYQESQGNDVVFYDKKGNPIYLQYRIDQWDYKNDSQVEMLRPGVTYKVTFIYKGVRTPSIPLPVSPHEYKNRIRSRKTVFSGRYSKHAEALADSLRL